MLLEQLRPGMRLALAVSGGADSIALLRALAAESSRLGLVLSVAHVHHGIRGEHADQDAAFVEQLSGILGLAFHRKDVDTPAFARSAGIGLEEAARALRYGWFAELLHSGIADAVATAHTLNDQAETVLHRLLRGAWTEGLAGIYPELAATSPGAAVAERGPAGIRSSAAPPGGLILRPLLGATRADIVAWLTSIGQPWQEDASNADLTFTRNRIRHVLLPELATYNPQMVAQLAQVAEIAREEEAYWQAEVKRLLPGLLLPGRAVRGGGRASSTLPGERSLSIEVERLRALHPALVRRLLRAAAKELGVALDFEQTGRLVALLESRSGTAPKREELTGELRAERSPRELRLLFSARCPSAGRPSAGKDPLRAPEVEIPVPGEGESFGVRLQLALAEGEVPTQEKAILRAALPADRVQLRYSRGAPKKIKEVLERLGIPAADRAGWPVLVWRGEIVWMRGAVLELSETSRALLVEAAS